MSDDEFEAKVAKAKADIARDLAGVKRVSPALFTPGYFEIHGVRFYDDDMVIDRYGQPVIRKGKMEIHQDRAEYLRHLERAMMLDPDPEYRAQAKAEYLKLTKGE